MDQNQDQSGTGLAGAARCARCGVPLPPTPAGGGGCVICLAGPVWPGDGWSERDEEIPPVCQDCGDLLIPEVTALPAGVPGRRERCRVCAAIGPCRDCGDAIICGYNDVPGAVVGRRLCRDCAPDPTGGGDDLLVVVDTTVDDPVL
ncbi:hypothetical protein [Frankia sp. R82]|uniref:hypothetical protein n=1 Tax=Frankia sp. R82 TaxID=2950553 RepID=UPI002043C888|nr:hypothetical protein [Frankia sp. R82]MCM3882682.1 hypothetical protein [Frankia sp. R82]